MFPISKRINNELIITYSCGEKKMHKSFPIVTIGIPTYNRANSTLSLTINSACNQDYPNLEIIVSDNCSFDNTKAIVSSFNDERIKYIRQKKNIGANNNYNACLNAAKGDYFLLLHDDDLIDDDFVSTCLRAAQYSTVYGFIRTGTRHIGKDGKFLMNTPNFVYSNNPDEMFSAWINWKSSFYLCSTLFNTQGLKEIGGFKSKNNLFEDGFAIIKLSANHPILNIVDVKSSFRHHDEQRTHAADALNWSEDFRQALDMIYLQDPVGRKELYEKGMRLYAMVSISFALKAKNPIKRAISVLFLGKYFPYYYWPDWTATAWKWKVIRSIAKLIFHEKKDLSN
jgi:glycosyltransferase involved in cell wall biosynthesis